VVGHHPLELQEQNYSSLVVVVVLEFATPVEVVLEDLLRRKLR
jgi:hypothetical protein